MTKPRLSVHKFSSCDGCQLALLNMGEDLLTLTDRVNIVHFAEAGYIDPNGVVDISLIEGSVSTSADQDRIQLIRKQSKYLVTIGACATSGGLQALRNNQNASQWRNDIYTNPEFIDSLATSTPISDHVRVDYQLWGCPINSRQLVLLLHSIFSGVTPIDEVEKVCLECKRKQLVCTLVTKSNTCLGPVTRTGCGALCPSVNRACYACYGPAENSNVESLANCFEGFGLLKTEIQQRFQMMHCNAPAFQLESAAASRPGKSK